MDELTSSGTGLYLVMLCNVVNVDTTRPRRPLSAVERHNFLWKPLISNHIGYMIQEYMALPYRKRPYAFVWLTKLQGVQNEGGAQPTRQGIGLRRFGSRLVQQTRRAASGVQGLLSKIVHAIERQNPTPPTAGRASPSGTSPSAATGERRSGRSAPGGAGAAHAATGQTQSAPGGARSTRAAPDRTDSGGAAQGRPLPDDWTAAAAAAAAAKEEIKQADILRMQFKRTCKEARQANLNSYVPHNTDSRQLAEGAGVD